MPRRSNNKPPNVMAPFPSIAAVATRAVAHGVMTRTGRFQPVWKRSYDDDVASKHRLLDPLELFWIQKAPFYVCYV